MKKTDHTMIQQVLDGSISREAFDGFQRRMREEPQLAKLYGDYALLHHSLCEEFEDQPVSKVPTPPAGTSAGVRIAVMAAIVAILVAAVFYWKSAPGSKGSGANVELSADAIWLIEGQQDADSAPLALTSGATLKLTHGRAAISLAPDISVLLDAPASLTFVSKGLLHLSEGRGRFTCAADDGLEVTTPSMSATGSSASFGISTHREVPDELHVFEGQVGMRVNGKADGLLLAAGEAGKISGADEIERITPDDAHFPKTVGRFETIVGGPFLKANWRVDYGKANVSEDRVDGENFAVFLRLPVPEPTAENPVLLATLTAGRPTRGEFHTDGWAGMSFFSEGTEMVFFGDSFGPEKTWSLDVKQRIPIILPGSPVIGPRTVTLRYDRRTGDASLHEGGIPLGPAFCSGKLPVGATFDDIRLGASSSAALAVSSLVVRVGGGSE